MINVDNYQDILDSRDVIARIDELKSMIEAYEDEDEDNDLDADDAIEYREELTKLEALAEEAAGYASDWTYGEALIRNSYFETYAEELADDLVEGFREMRWPLNHIDWKAAAEELQQDYTEIDFDGVAYWIRNS